MRGTAHIWVAALSAVLSAASACPVERVGCCTFVHVCAEASLRVVHTAQDGQAAPESLVVVGYAPPFPEYQTAASADGTVFNVTTGALRAEVTVATGAVRFIDPATDAVVGQEGPHTFGQSTRVPHLYQGMQAFVQHSDEGMYGGGEFQNGLLNWKDTPVDLAQFNTEAAVPFFVSTRGYGVLWEGYSWTHVNQGTDIPLSGNGTFKGTLTTTSAGRYGFLLTQHLHEWAAGRRLVITLTVSGEPDVVVQDWETGLLPSSIAGHVVLLAQKTYTVTVETDQASVKLTYNRPDTGVFSIMSDTVAVIDYHFMYGKSIEGSIGLYRKATGIAPLYSKKTFGFWQCKNRYHNQSELVGAAQRYRDLNIPIDTIVQDWMYWGSLGWGPHWDHALYPDPKQMVEALHADHINLMVSVWSKFSNDTSFYQEMQAAGHIIRGSLYYDPYSASAREMYYNFSKAAHFDIGVDSLWLDATEPELYPHSGQELSVGWGDQYFNPFSLMTTAAVAEGLRRDFRSAQGARVFTLTRSAFAGQQRTGAALWSGDTIASFDTLRRQIVGSVNYQLSGIPYWSQDIGGFYRPNDQYTSSEYQQLLVRWFQFGAFTPIFRLHGTADTELWNYGDTTMQLVNTTAMALRYRFLPYTYSGFHDVEAAGSTMQRALVFDFAGDTATHSIGDQFMWGGSVLVAPVYTAGNPATRPVYLPAGSAWCNFHTGATQQGGQWVNVSAPLAETPLFLRAGSIVVLGPLVQHTGETVDPLEVRVCNGGDASYQLYEDDGVSPTVDVTATQLVDAPHSLIGFKWVSATQTLTISPRSGSFPGMLQTRNLNVYRVRSGHGVGTIPATPPDATLAYTGKQVDVVL